MTPAVAASVYVHAPFCARRCFYCDFAVSVRAEARPEPWAEALGAELRQVEKDGRLTLADTLDTLYVGGGTPSLLGPDAMRALADVLTPSRLRSPLLEWTAEANPESFTPEVAGAWRRAGVNRLSLGTQSFHEHVLRWMGRLHGAEGAERAVHTARAAGFEDVSVDLIFGLPAAVDRDWKADLDRVIALDVPHLSLYGLTAEHATPLGRAVTEGRIEMVTDSRYEDEYLEATTRLTAAGYEHYEVSNFGRPGHRSRHNQVYWSGAPYLGLGNGAHSYAHPERRWNIRDWEEYRAAANAGRLPIVEREELDVAAERLERIWLGLRTVEGLPVAWSETGPAATLVAGWAASGVATVVGGRVVLTAEGWLVLDRLTVELDDAWHADAARGPGGAPADSRPG
jgi:oxygen-independent coproporphyrinogen-3 oxidase